MTASRSVIFAYGESWSSPLRTSKHHYARLLGRLGWKVLFLEVPPTSLTALLRPGYFFGDWLPRRLAGVRQVDANVWAYTSFWPVPYHRDRFRLTDRLCLNALNQRWALQGLRRVMARLGMENPALVSYYPLIYPVIDAIAPGRIMLHMVDEWQGLPGIPRSMEALTRAMAARADITLVTSQPLFERYRSLARNIRLLRHGTDTGLFAPVARREIAAAPEFAAMPGPRVGYFGALRKLDLDLVAEVASRRPGWTFLFVGPVTGPQGLGRPESLPANVLLPGALPRERLPAFLAAIDAFWMPFQNNDLTNAMCPIKLYEALSAGMPIVSTDLVEVRAASRGMIALATTADSHIAALDAAITDTDAARRLARLDSVSGMDWSDRIRTFEALLAGSDSVGPKPAREV